jgi:hypothetical protein
MQDNYQAKVKSIYINPDHHKKYEERLTYDNDRLELYRLLTRDITLLHQEQLGHNLTKSHHDTIAKDVYDIVTDHSHKLKQYLLTDQDKVMVADKVCQKMSAPNWWQDFTKDQLNLSMDKIASIEAAREAMELLKVREAEASIQTVFSAHENLVKTIQHLAPSYDLEEIKEQMQVVNEEYRSNILKNAALDVFKKYVTPHLQQIAEEKSEAQTTDEVFKVLEKEKEFCTYVYNQYTDLSLLLKEQGGDDQILHVATTYPDMIFHIKQGIHNIQKLEISLYLDITQELKNAKSLAPLNNELYEVCRDYLSKQAHIDLEKIEKTGETIVDRIRFTDKDTYLEYIMLDPTVKLYLGKDYEHIFTNKNKNTLVENHELQVHELYTQNRLLTENDATNNDSDSSKINNILTQLSKTMEDLGIDCSATFKRALNHYLEYQNYSIDQVNSSEQLKNIIRRAEFEETSYQKWKFYLKNQLKENNHQEKLKTVAGLMELEISADKMAKMHSGLYHQSDKIYYMSFQNNKDLRKVVEYFDNARAEKIYNLLENHDKVSELAKVNEPAARLLAASIADYEMTYTPQILTPQRLEIMSDVSVEQAKLADVIMLKFNEHNHLSGTALNKLSTEIQHKDEQKAVEFSSLRLGQDMTNDMLLHDRKTGYYETQDIDHHHREHNEDHLDARNSHERHYNNVKEHIHDTIRLTKNMQNEHNREIEQQKQQEEINKQHFNSIKMDF